eukprot:GDKJ01021781.1.p1 GENE.GDKJ01021781.1~~GDKJ01021781.1.p1  ORF type:complete len:236 (-),score=43.00 GDKJ01021781.1:431-1138(-)
MKKGEETKPEADEQSVASRKESMVVRKESVAPSPADAPNDEQSVVSMSASPSRNKKQIAKELQSWKENFKADNGREPTKGDIASDPEAGPLYRQFQDMKKDSEKDTSRNASFASPPPPIGEGDAKSSASSPPNAVGEGDEQTQNVAASEGVEEVKQHDSTAATATPAVPISAYVLEQQQELHNRKKELNKSLNEWKVNFQNENGRAPKGSDIQQSPAMSALYDELRQIKAQLGAE